MSFIIIMKQDEKWFTLSNCISWLSLSLSKVPILKLYTIKNVRDFYFVPSLPYS